MTILRNAPSGVSGRPLRRRQSTAILAMTAVLFCIATECAWAQYGGRYPRNPQGRRSWRTAAQEESSAPKPPSEQITGVETRDGVLLAATFFPGNASEDTIPVLMLHDLEGSRKDLIPLAEALAAKGHAVLVPDLRGHGASTTKREQVRGELKETKLEADDLRVTDYRDMVRYDMATWRSWLVEKNNDRRLNLDKLVLVGARFGCAVALEFARIDWSIPSYRDRKQSRDVKAAVLLSPEWQVPGFLLNKTLMTPAVNRRLSYLIAVGKDDFSLVRDAERIEKLLNRDRPDVSGLPPDEALREKSVWYGEIPTSLQGAELIQNPQLRLAEHILRFIDIRVREGEDAPWKEHF